MLKSSFLLMAMAMKMAATAAVAVTAAAAKVVAAMAERCPGCVPPVGSLQQPGP
jgi:hypothetical protein